MRNEVDRTLRARRLHPDDQDTRSATAWTSLASGERGRRPVHRLMSLAVEVDVERSGPRWARLCERSRCLLW